MLSPRTIFQATRPLARSFSAQAARQNVARVTLVGRLAADPVPSLSGAGREYIRYAVSHNKRQDGEEKTSWFTVFCFDQRSKDYTMSLRKGTLVYVDGSISADKIIGEDGKTYTTFFILQHSVNALVRPKGSEEQQEQQEQQEE
ncbi:hypothetical protein FN846DRAFT_904676 [Sphaerosporella brunnea]|uniref:Single-stranded DNA-binding protein n=1 Tax=Sphaerosporella brunnea TaxID=1250544 RepID=A0A5J5F3P9_9PEZI|nr:hypothetical protein FN846DRAFT_904676 [Sphaerosporella brunnea]